jgi:hypothetical protein
MARKPYDSQATPPRNITGPWSRTALEASVRVLSVFGCEQAVEAGVEGGMVGARGFDVREPTSGGQVASLGSERDTAPGGVNRAAGRKRRAAENIERARSRFGV